MNELAKHPCQSGPQRTPCNRIRLGEAFDINQDCHLCHKFAHDVQYNLAWGGSGKVVPIRPGSVPVLEYANAKARQPQREDIRRHPPRFRNEHPCVHLGDFTGETRDCGYCGGGKNIPVRACAIHGRCTSEKKLAYREPDGSWVQVEFCLSCADYQPRE